MAIKDVLRSLDPTLIRSRQVPLDKAKRAEANGKPRLPRKYIRGEMWSFVPDLRVISTEKIHGKRGKIRQFVKNLFHLD